MYWRLRWRLLLATGESQLLSHLKATQPDFRLGHGISIGCQGFGWDHRVGPRQDFHRFVDWRGSLKPLKGTWVAHLHSFLHGCTQMRAQGEEKRDGLEQMRDERSQCWRGGQSSRAWDTHTHDDIMDETCGFLSKTPLTQPYNTQLGSMWIEWILATTTMLSFFSLLQH
jgi:hypothetical protein